MKPLGLAAVPLLLASVLASTAEAAPPEPVDERRSEAKRSRELSWLSAEERARLREVDGVAVKSRPVDKQQFAFELEVMCTRFLAWKRGTPKSAVELRELSETRSIVERVAAANGDPIATVLLARELSDTIAGLRSICDRVELGSLTPEQLDLLRLAYEGELGDDLGQLQQVHDKARTELGALLDKTAIHTDEAALRANVASFTDDAQDFSDKAEAELSGRRASAFTVSSLGAAGRRAFEGLASFLVDRARQEAIEYLRAQLVERICNADADPILFIPATCKLLARSDANMSLSAMGVALRTALISDFELLPDRLIVLASMSEAKLAYSGTALRVLIPLLRDARARNSPLEYVAALHASPAIDCERLAAPGHGSAEQGCADTMALLRLASMVVHATTSHTSTQQRSASRPYLVLAIGLSLEQRFGQMPAEAQARILAELGWAKFEFDGQRLALLGELVESAELALPELERTIETLADQLGAGERPVILDEEAYRLARMAAVQLAELGSYGLEMLPAAAEGAPSPGTWRAELATALTELPHAFDLARAYADEDWGPAVLGTLEFLAEQFERHGSAQSSEHFDGRIAGLSRYLPLAIEIANAKSSDQVNQALQAAFPVGGYKRKFQQSSISIGGFVGLYGGLTLASSLDAADQTSFGRTGGEFSLFAPVGVELSGPVARNRPRPSHLGLLFGVLDLGAITTSKWIEQQSNPPVDDGGGTGTIQTELSEPAAFNIAGLVTPGAYLTVGLANSPFSLGVGASISPFAHQLRQTERDMNGDIEAVDARYLPAVRIGAFLAVDITFVSFGLR